MLGHRASFAQVFSLTQPQALPSTTASSLKRYVPDDFDDVDSENIDPLMFSSPFKKACGSNSNIGKSDKTPLFALTPAKKPAQYVESPQAAGQKRKAEGSTPNNGLLSKKRAQPSSAPTPAGRSPKSKKAGILSRRRMTASSFTRVNPPAFSSGALKSGLPFSIDAALAGTMPASKTKTKSNRRKEWHFEIYEDAPGEFETNLMNHSACTLDISDDESHASAKEDKDNKENIPPTDGPATITLSTQIAASRRDMMTDEPRSPLGDLNAADFYAEGCDPSSVFIIGGEDSQNAEGKCATASNLPEPSSPNRPRANAVSNQGDWKETISRFATKTTSDIPDSNPTLLIDELKAELSPIEIWESDSAKGDDNDLKDEQIIDGPGHQPLLA